MGLSFSSIVMILLFVLIAMAFLLVLFGKSSHGSSKFNEMQDNGAHAKLMKMKQMRRGEYLDTYNDRHDPLISQQGFYK